MTSQKSGVEPLFRIVKRDNLPKWKAWIIRVIAIAAALLLGAIISAGLTGGSGFGTFFVELFDGVFGTERRILNFFQNTAILLCIALAVTPAFKMRFWNIGAEGQVLMGGLGSVICMFYIKNSVPEWALLLIMAATSLAFGMVWAVIPAVFKAKWKTNETLFTLMLNYIAMGLISICIAMWVPTGSQNLSPLPYGRFPLIGGQRYILNIIIVAVVAVAMFLYFRFSKHGYELTVVGESENTAKYVGINVKKVIIRTMILSGALCGLAGLLLVAGTGYTIGPTTVDNRGFTAILVSWLGKFSVLGMTGTTMLYVFIDMGVAEVAKTFNIGEAFPDIITGVFFFLVIACEFFINYKIKFRSLKKKRTEATVEEVAA